MSVFGLQEVIIESWMERLFCAPHDRRGIRLQGCVDRIELHEIVSVTPQQQQTPGFSTGSSRLDENEPVLLGV
jgi:hypothetical protein